MRADSPFKLSDSASVFRRHLLSRGVNADWATLREMIEGALSFYRGVAAAGLAASPDADMLLFQFGVYDWGQGEHFEIDVTRQFMLDGAEDDDALSQLRCATLFEPTAELRNVGTGHRWCQSRADLDTFREFILSSNAYAAAARSQPIWRDIVWSPV